MVTNLGNIQTHTPRHAESADARLDIRRQEPDQEQRKKNEREAESDAGFDSYDNTVISLESLRVFLLNFLQSLLDIARKNSTPNFSATTADLNDPVGNEQSPERQQIAPQAAHAINAYQSAARAAPSPRITQPDNIKPDETLENEEIREIHDLLKDIDQLLAKNITSIMIEQNETFVKSLSAAVKKALAG